MKLAHLPVCAELFHTPAGKAYADFMIGGHRETWPIRSRRFRAFLRHSYYRATGAAASAAVIDGALDQLEARAQLVHLRVSERDGALYFDLADDNGERLRSPLRVGRSFPLPQFAFAGLPGCCRCLNRNGVARF